MPLLNSIKAFSADTLRDLRESLGAGLPAAKALEIVPLSVDASVFAGGAEYWLPGNGYGDLAGDLWLNSAVAACLNWMITSFPEAPACLMKRGDGNKLAPVENDPLGATGLLASPNPAYDDTVLWAGTLISYVVNGNGYWRIERNGYNEPSALWYVPHFLMTPKREGADFISYYEYRPGGGTPQRIAPRDVVHFRYGLDPRNLMLGMSPLASVAREIFTDSEATDYSASVLKNNGALGGVASWDGRDYDLDPDDFLARWNAKTTGGNRGRMQAYNAPITLSFPDNSPEKMALDTIRKYPETRICAVLGIPPMVVQLSAGLDRSTFSNYAEARTAAWEDTLLPMQRMMGRQATRQLISQWPGAIAKGYVLGFDTREVRALSEDVDALYKRYTSAWTSNLIDRATAKTGIGIDPDRADAGLYFADIAPPASGGFDEGINAVAADTVAVKQL